VQWVATEIVAGETFKSRAYLIKRFVQLADRLRSMNNFDGLKSVVCGLQISGILRLRRSWELLSTKYQTLFEELTQLMSEERSCKAYRALLQTAQPPCIPFLGTLLLIKALYLFI
jgi:son of sevenless-like protein